MFSGYGTRKSRLTISAVLVTAAGSLALSSFSSLPNPSTTFRLQKIQRRDSPLCTSSLETFSGEVKRGEVYEHDINAGLTFGLRASHDPATEGWPIQIMPKIARQDARRPDWAWPLNPPYRGYNAQNVSVSFDFRAKDAIKYPRKFRFPLNEVDAKWAVELYEKLESSTGQQCEEAIKELNSFASGTGSFKITDSRLSPSGPENPKRGRIEWLKFSVSKSLPCRAP